MEKPEPYNPANIGRLAIFGTAIGGPILTVWYIFNLYFGKNMNFGFIYFSIILMIAIISEKLQKKLIFCDPHQNYDLRVGKLCGASFSSHYWTGMYIYK